MKKELMIYLAAGWFSHEQEQARQEIYDSLKSLGFKFYSPKEDCLYRPGGIVSSFEVFKENIQQIAHADFVVASTEGKDMGTLFECGVAYQMRKPIIYYFKSEGKFNLMLAESAIAVCQTRAQLHDCLRHVQTTGKIKEKYFKGEIE
jgi:nucleoside 2-deoxyribosyltransferase